MDDVDDEPRSGQKMRKSGVSGILTPSELQAEMDAIEAEEEAERIALGASGGKDSTVLIHVMTTLNKRYDYGLDLQLLSVDEGITGYRDDSLETVKKN